MQALVGLGLKDNTMGISSIYNSIKGGINKAGNSLSSMFESKPTTIYRRPEQGNLQASVQEAMSQPQQAPVQQLKIPNRDFQVTDDDIQKMRPLIYGEVSNRDYGKKQMEADVIFNTALNRQLEYRKYNQDRSISDIVAMPNQYQAYGGDQYQTYYNPKNPVDVAKKKEVDAIVDAIAEKIRKGEYVDNTEGAFYYIHEDDGKIKYDNIKKLFK